MTNKIFASKPLLDIPKLKRFQYIILRIDFGKTERNDQTAEIELRQLHAK